MDDQIPNPKSISWKSTILIIYSDHVYSTSKPLKTKSTFTPVSRSELKNFLQSRKTQTFRSRPNTSENEYLLNWDASRNCPSKRNLRVSTSKSIFKNTLSTDTCQSFKNYCPFQKQSATSYLWALKHTFCQLPTSLIWNNCTFVLRLPFRIYKCHCLQ